MQAHLHGLFEGRDLLYDDEYEALGMSPLFAFVSSEGVVSNHWPAGASFLQAPGWLLGRVAGESLVGSSVSERAASYAVPLLGLRGFALVVLAGLLVAVATWLRRRATIATTALACAAFCLGTPLLYYTLEAPIRPHLWGAVVVTALVLRWFEAVEAAARDPERARGRLRIPVELAALAGLATAIRPQLAPLALLVAHERVVAGAGLDLRKRARLLVLHGLPAAIVFAIWPLVVLRMQLWMYGELGGYASTAELSHHLRAFLLSTHHGALTWCPVLLLGALGLAVGAARREHGAALLLVLVAMQVWLDAGTREIEPYAVLGTRTWTGGTAFGPRKLLDAIPLMLPGVVWLERWLDSLAGAEAARWRRRLTLAAALALVPTTLLLIAAWLDPRVTSEVLDGERLLIAMSLPFDPGNWRAAWSQRAVAGPIVARVALVVALPSALGLVAGLALWRRRGGSTKPVCPACAHAGWVSLLVAGLLANLWLSVLIARSETLLANDPQRMRAAAARLNPWHELTVAEIPHHQALLRRRLDP